MTEIARLSPTTRSKVTNARLSSRITSRALFVEGDGRSQWGRRYRDLCALIADDLGGAATLSELKMGLVRRQAALMVEAERLEASLANGEKVDVDLLGRISGHVRRIAETLGLDRVKRDVTPTLEVIAARHKRTFAE